MQSVVSCEPVLLSSRDAAKLLAVSERTLFDLARSGALEKVRIGTRGVRYRKSDIEHFGNRRPAA
jgi:excisionase family DNA binding protein